MRISDWSSDVCSSDLTMFGVTTKAVQQIAARLEDRYDCLVFHATGVGGRSLEKLADSGLLAAAIDLTTTEVCDMMMGGVFPADADRDRKSTRLNSSHYCASRMPSSA